MQHWNVFRKWNERLFCEMWTAYQQGRAAVNPASFWAAGEIGFFEYYVIPLAKKLKDCGVFGVASDEYLNYALQNLAEWKAKGDEIVAEMVMQLELLSSHNNAALEETVIASSPVVDRVPSTTTVTTDDKEQEKEEQQQQPTNDTVSTWFEI
jgi:hypothetical protein